MKTLWTIQHDLLQAADCSLDTTAKTAINQAVADITTVQDALEEALDQAWDAPNPDAAKPHIQTCYTLAHLGTRLSKRTQALYDAKCQVEKVKTKLQATDPEAANTLARLIATITQELSPLQELERGQTWPALIATTTLELGDSTTAKTLRAQALTLFTQDDLPPSEQLEQCVIAITAMATLVNSLAYYGGGPNVYIAPLLEWYAPTNKQD